MTQTIVTVESLTVDLPPWGDRPHAVEGVSLELRAGEIL
jgi:peptide/nickel transport system ATP-binding protein